MHSRHSAASRVGVRSPLWALVALLGLAACGPLGGVDDADTAGAGGQSGAAGAPALPPAPAFKLVGYQPSWAGSISNVQFDKLNYINYAFATELADGSVTLPQPTQQLLALTLLAHKSGVRVLLSVGGWNNGDASAFSTLSANPDARAKFVATVDGFVDQFQLDGIDIDWEYPRASDTASFTALVQAVSARLQPKGKILTMAAAPATYGSEGVTADAMQYLDFVNIMAYDGGQGAGHSPYTLAQSALQTWLTKGLPASKAVLGVPFYSRPSNTPYSKLVAMDPNAANVDQIGDQYYNGIPTLQAKTELAMTEGTGVMEWDLSQDVNTPGLSLVSAIFAKAHPSP